MYYGLIKNTINKLSASIIKPKRPYVPVQVNGHNIAALYDTGADISCMNSKTFRKLFPVDKRPPKTHQVSHVNSASGTALNCEGVFQMTMIIDRKECVHPVRVFSNLNENFIIGIDFATKFGLGFDPSTAELYWTDQSRNRWNVANLQCSEQIKIEPTSNKVVTLNVITQRGFRVAEAIEAVAAISSQEYVIQGGPALVKINRMGQTSMEIFNCTNHVMTIEKGSILGIIESIHEEEDSVAALDLDSLIATVEATPPNEQSKITEQKKKFIMENAKLNVPEEFRQRYIDLLLRNHEVISSDKYDLGKCTTSMHDIELKSEDPIYIKQFRIPEAQREDVQKHVEELLKLGVVRPSRSKFNSPIFVVKKKDGGLRIVQDFRAINLQTQVDKYSMRDVQECIDEIGRAGSTIFSTIDLTSGFWQMMLNPECRKYTAFTLPGLGQFEWNASPMGLLGAPGSFQRLMEIVILNLKNVLAYIDDLLVHTKDHNTHLQILEELFIRLRKHGLKINLPKSFFGAVEVSYLGFKLTPQGIKPGSDKLKAVGQAAPPNDIHEVRQFLGLCNFFRGHVRNFAQVTAPLNALTRKDCEWKRGPLPPDAAKAFQELKTILCSEPVVHYPQPELPYALITDACQGDAKKPGGYGAILAQIQPDGQFQVISYASRKLKCHEKNYAPFLLEMSASVWAMDHYSVYLKGKHFVLYTDHKPLVKLGTVHNKTLNRMQEAMLEFDFEIIYQKGSEMPADFLSRNVVDMISAISDDEEMEKLQNEETWIKEIKAFMLNNTPIQDHKAKLCMNYYWANRFFIENNLLWVRFQYRGEPSRVCLVLPSTKVKEVLREGHGTLFTGHEGVAKTRFRVTQNYWWPSIDKDIGEFIKSCVPCQKTRTDIHPKPDVLTPLPICTEPNQRLHADLFGALTTSSKNKKFILSMTDAFTKYVEIVALPNKEADTVADAIFAHWFCRYGIPMEIITDQGKEFCNKLSDELFKLMEVKHGRTSAYHPQCNAQAEVGNKTIAKYLRTVVDTSTNDWENYLAPLMFTYNTSFHRTIQTSPYFLTFGAIARQPAFNQGDWNRKYYGETTAAEKFQQLQYARQVAWKNSHHQQELNREVYNRQAAPHQFQKGQYVLLKIENFKDKNRKLANQYEGPYQIIKLKPKNNVELNIRKRTNVIVHVNRLKPYYDDSEFKNFEETFSKQGGDKDIRPPRNEQIEIQNEKKRGRGRPKKETKPKPTTESESESENENIEKRPRYEFRRRNPEPVIEMESETESEEEESESEMESESENEEGQNEDGQDKDGQAKPKIIVPQLFKAVNLIKNDLIKINHLGMQNPFIAECRKLIKDLPSGFLKREYPNWNENQVINFWWSGDINGAPEEMGISLAEHPYQSPSLLLQNRIPVQPQLPVQVQQQPVEEEDEDENFQTPPGSPASATGPAAPAAGTAGPSVPSSNQFRPYNLGNVRPELRTASFAEASKIPNLNADEQEHFKRSFYLAHQTRELQQEEGRATRHNPSGFRMFAKKTKPPK